jgi:hypothetical protein
MSKRVGTRQKFSLIDFPLVLELRAERNFDASSGSSGYGFERVENEDIEVEYNLLGNAFIRVSPYYVFPRFDFEWNLFLNSDERSILEMLVGVQRRRLANRQPDYEIIVEDEYLPLLEADPVEREEVTPDDNSPSLPELGITIPSGFKLYYPKYKVLITEGVQHSFFYDGLWKTKVVAKEVLANEAE